MALITRSYSRLASVDAAKLESERAAQRVVELKAELDNAIAASKKATAKLEQAEYEQSRVKREQKFQRKYYVSEQVMWDIGRKYLSRLEVATWSTQMLWSGNSELILPEMAANAIQRHLGSDSVAWLKFAIQEPSVARWALLQSKKLDPLPMVVMGVDCKSLEYLGRYGVLIK